MKLCWGVAFIVVTILAVLVFAVPNPPSVPFGWLLRDYGYFWRWLLRLP